MNKKNELLERFSNIIFNSNFKIITNNDRFEFIKKYLNLFSQHFLLNYFFLRLFSVLFKHIKKILKLNL